MKKIELLSPAGDIEKLKIAYLYGADSCYIGGQSYSLRANANNFSLDEIEEATKFAHKLNKKIYVTVNIVFHNEDLEGVEKYLEKLNDIKVDGVIICDIFLLPIIREKFKNLKIIFSTQGSTTNTLSVEYLKNEGVSTVVVAREVGKKDIKEIISKTGASIEVFLHGAMCSNISGRCVLSNYFTNRDANRGGCCQVCRFNFNLDGDPKKKFSFATKDLMLAKEIKELIEIGVDTLKIEGRMRSSYYIATVISCYRNIIDAYYNNTFDKKVLKKYTKILERVANRPTTSQFFNKEAGFNDQYYLDRNEVSKKDFLGIVLDYDEKTNFATIEQRNYFKKGQVVNVFGPNNLDYTFKIQNIYNEDMEEIDVANHPREILKIKVDKKLDKDSMIRVNLD